MQEQTHDIYTRKYKLTIRYCGKKNEIHLFFLSKINNCFPTRFDLLIPNELMDDDGVKTFRKLRRHRQRFIQTNFQAMFPILTLNEPIKKALPFIESFAQIGEIFSIIQQSLQKEKLKSQNNQQEIKKEKEKVTRQMELHQEMTKESIESNYKRMNNGFKYRTVMWENLQLKAMMNPFKKQIIVTILQKRPLVIAETTIPLRSLKKKSSPFQNANNLKEMDLLQEFFNKICQSSEFSVSWEKNIFSMRHELVKDIPLNTFSPKQLILKDYEDDLNHSKVEIFKHIFLTQVIAHMIITHFWRMKWKEKKERDGLQQAESEDQELEELRKSGYRFSEFRDHPIYQKRKKNKRKKSNDSSSSEEQQKKNQQWKKKYIENQTQNKLKNDKKQIQQKRENIIKDENTNEKLYILGERLKKKEGICNFILISGEEKSHLNKMRYCLHQMTRETDKTQAMINFIQLVFSAVEREQLVGRWGGTETELRKTKKMKHFVSKVKAKRSLLPCLTEYTRQSFFHRVLNIGLRVFQNPHELIYLRLGFSHIFWSIKFLYHRHKRAIFESKQKKQKTNFRLYRGCKLEQEEILMIRDNIQGYLEAEGFLSTSANPQRCHSKVVSFFFSIKIKYFLF